jgi:outer membrane protein TolC
MHRRRLAIANRLATVYLLLAASSSIADAQDRPLQLGGPALIGSGMRANEGLIEDNEPSTLPDPPTKRAAEPSNKRSSRRTASAAESDDSRTSDAQSRSPAPSKQDRPQQDTPKRPLVNIKPLELGVRADVSANGVEAVVDEELLLGDVVASVYRAYPDVAASKLESQRTDGELTSAYGWYDTKLKGYTLNEPSGFYENYRHGIGAARQTWWGGYLSAGYRIGRGEFQPWYKERETDKGGELKASWRQALLQGRAIDPARVAVFQASVQRNAVSPLIQQTILETARDSAFAYWKWVAEGNVLKAQRELLELAQKRNEQFEVGVKAGKFPEIDLILNQQLVAERQAKLLEVQRKYQAAGFKLSLFLRDESGEPMLPQKDWLPSKFPITEVPSRQDFQTDLAAAIERRPEFQLFRLKQKHLQYDYQLALNQTLPQLDFIAEASKDFGEDASSSDDKDELLVILGLQGELPIQRRKARGKMQSTQAKIAQLEQKIRIQSDKVAADLRTGFATLELFAERVEQADLSLRAAFETLDRYRFAFTKGKVDLLYLNLIETKAYETEIKLIEAQQQWFSALAELQAAMGLDPLSQATAVDAMPDSDHPGPGNLPIASNETAADEVSDEDEKTDSE